MINGPKFPEVSVQLAGEEWASVEMALDVSEAHWMAAGKVTS